MTSVEDLTNALRAFAERRNWQQFHDAKNLSMALSAEAGELTALIQWVRTEDLPAWLSNEQNARALRLEIADVLAYILYLADSVGVDPAQALLEKIGINESRYPAHLSTGVSTKYTDLGESP